MKLKALHEDILGDIKRKLKGQVSRADNIERVAKFELKTALSQAETILDLVGTSKGDPKKVTGVAKTLVKNLKGALRDLDRIK